jgi:hypothetical protein
MSATRAYALVMDAASRLRKAAIRRHEANGRRDRLMFATAQKYGRLCVRAQRHALVISYSNRRPDGLLTVEQTCRQPWRHRKCRR